MTSSANQRNLIEFLRALARIRAKPVPRLEAYDRTLWLDQIPERDSCFSRHRSAADDDDADLWVSVQKEKEPVLPDPPEICEPWIGSQTLDADADGDPPSLLPRIEREVEESDDLDDHADDAWSEASENRDPEDEDLDDEVTTTYEIVELRDHPEVQAAWDEWIGTTWLPWAERHREWRKLHQVYTTLFAIHQDLQTKGEQLELALGVGLLDWDHHEDRIQRHVLTVRAELLFDAKRGRFEVRPHPLEATLHVELDMVPPASLPLRVESTTIEGIQAAEGDPWAREVIEPVLRSVANQLDESGHYEETDRRPTGSSSGPMISRSPALLLRKRSSRSETKFLETILKKIEEGSDDVPAAWIDLAEDASSDDDHEREQHRSAARPREVFFPLPSNDEQLEILRCLGNQPGATVQGPPGTGKSHTIANLICHLLATGKRILISAQTARALDVLHGKLPEEIRPLAVSMLGEGKTELSSLESSVRGITDRHGTDSAAGWEQRAQELSAEREKQEQQAARLRHRIRAVRERDAAHNEVGGFKGSAATIAAAIAEDAERFAWFTDEVSYTETVSLEPETFTQLAAERRHLLASGHAGLRLRATQIAGLPDPEEFRRLVEREATARTAADGEQAPDALTQSHRDSLQTLIAALEKARDARSRATAVPRPWLDAALAQVVGRQDAAWRSRAAETRRLLAEIPESPDDAASASLELPDGRSWHRIARDATVARDHLDRGKALTGLRALFCPPEVRATRYLIEEVRVGGGPPVTRDDFDLLVRVGRCEAAFHALAQLWEGLEAAPSGPGAVRRSTLSQILETLEYVLEAGDAVREAEDRLATVPAIAAPDWTSSESIVATLDLARRSAAALDAARYARAFDDVAEALRGTREDASADVDRMDAILAAVDARDSSSYEQHWTESRTWEDLDRRAERLDEQLEEIARTLPDIARMIQEGLASETAEERAATLLEAIHRAMARSYVREVLHEADPTALLGELDRTEAVIRQLTGEEAAARAWAATFSRMTEAHKRSLIAWQQSMKRLGKGTGKHAEKHRLDARKHLAGCREAIPAWIMPLHRVFDTVDPAPGMFDVVIVDEASQCGLNALPLIFLGKKVLVVGDDEQISPSAVGIDWSILDHKAAEFLSSFRMKSSFAVDSSLFDHADLRFEQRIVLREHFRCMPEIIRFSNDLCYKRKLRPIRDFGSDRLPPLRHVHVADGARTGTGSRALNKPEAAALVAKIAECIEDDRYAPDGDPLTMGVISLTGDAQADHISNLLVERIGPEEMERRELVCGNAYDFQGDERDVMFLSLVAAPGVGISALTTRSARQRFNVAASRARDQMWLFHSVMPADLSPNCVRRSLLEHFLDPTKSDHTVAGIELDELQQIYTNADRQNQLPPRPFDSWFEVAVAMEILRRGYRVEPQYEHGGYRIDLLIQGSQARLAVECDGDHWHGPEVFEQDMHRQRALERVGLRFVRIRQVEFHADQEEALRPLWQTLERLGIEPVSRESTGGGTTPAAAEVASPSLAPPDEAAVTPEADPGVADPANRTDHASTPDGTDPADGSYRDAEEGPDGAVGSTEAPAAELYPEEGAPPVAAAATRAHATPAASGNGRSPSAKHDHDQIVEPYEAWMPDGSPLPHPETAPPKEIAAALERIIRVEGPVLATRAYRLYSKAAGLARAGKAVQRSLNRAAAQLERQRRLQSETEDPSKPRISAVLRGHGTPSVRPRTIGDRTFAEVPRSELAWMLAYLRRQDPTTDDETLIRQVATHYGLQRLRQPTRERLETILGSLQSA